MTVYESDFLRLDFFKDEQLIEMIWLPALETMIEEDYKEEFMNYLTIILDVKPKKVVSDTQNMHFPISVELQEWTNQTIFPPSLEMGLNKAAFVISSDIMNQLSVEQIMEETEGIKFTTQYFTTRKEAKEWILSLPLD